MYFLETLFLINMILSPALSLIAETTFIIGVVTIFIIYFIYLIIFLNKGTSGIKLGNELINNVKKYIIILFTISSLTSLFSIKLSPEDLFKIRVSLIKYELIKPENINKGLNHIDRIVKKLECKYLGCEKDKNTKK